ncbi:MAG TPA: GDSL-type esterase/lipase family protein [Burkholderiales bacterium]|nr:GDSL-type esterase/lipase family protein [Burkholderiales bacterium]
MRALPAAILAIAALSIAGTAVAATPNWVTAWAASVHGPYPIGNPSAQPDMKLAFPSAETGARDQSFRLIVRPDIWGKSARVRLSNAFGTRPVTFDGAYIGLQLSGSALVHGSNRPLRFGGKSAVTVAPGESAWSDAVALPFARDAHMLAGRKLAVSFHVAGESGPMTWHAKALTSSYVTLPGAGAHGAEEGEADFPASTASWYFLDALDMQMPAGTRTIVAFGDSITDGTASTMNGDDRWPDVLSRRIHAQYGERYAVVNAGIGGNQVAGPPEYTPQKPIPGGPSAVSRLQRDVLTLSNVGAVIWLEGINDFSKNGNTSVEQVIAGMKDVVGRTRASLPGVRVVGATVTSALGSSNGAHGHPEEDVKRKQLNDFIRTGGLFDAVADFDAVTLDTSTGSMKPGFVPESTTGGAGDKLHPNRMGYQAMGAAIDIPSLLPRKPARK